MVGLWLFIGLVLSLEVYFNVRLTKPDVHFLEIAPAQYQRTLFWAVLTPLVLWLRAAVPMSRGRWLGGVLFHLGVSVAFMTGYYLLRLAFAMAASGEAWGSFFDAALTGFYGRNFIDMAYYWAVIGVAYVLNNQQKYQRELLRSAQLEAKLVEAELRALKHQLNPHFLFNTLNTIAVLVREEKKDEAVRLLAQLGVLLRMALDNTRVQSVTLRQELDFLGRYLEIQKARFADRLNYHTAAEPAALDALIPNLILQPLVENAILHGVAQKSGPGSVEIAARVHDNRVEIEVRDDGPGFEINPGQPPKEGIGLANTRERLAKYYGKNHQMVLRSERGRGVTVSLVIPFLRSGAVQPA